MVALLRQRLLRLAEQYGEVSGQITEATGHGVHPLFVIEEEYRLALLDAEIAFVEGFIDKITNPTDGWGPQWAEFHAQRSQTS